MGSSRRQQKIRKYFDKITPIETKKRTREEDMREDREDKRLRMRDKDKSKIGDLKMEAAKGAGEAD